MTNTPDQIIKTAIAAAQLLTSGREKCGPEILRLDAETAVIIAEIDGVDHVLTISQAPMQRARPHQH